MSKTKTRYIKKPVVIDAWQWNGGPLDVNGVPDWLRRAVLQDQAVMLSCDSSAFGDRRHVVRIQTLEGVMHANIGDWIVRGIKGEFYPVRDDIFQETYRPADPVNDDDDSTSTPIQRAKRAVCDLLLDDSIDGYTLGRVLRVMADIEAESVADPRPAPPNVATIVEEWLRANGYDGLCIPGECGCEIDDLMPCGSPNECCCMAGYKGPPTPEGGDWAIYLSREAAAEAESVTDGEQDDNTPSDQPNDSRSGTQGDTP
jgi:hypothetical protein